MKKIFLLLVLATTLSSSCKKNETCTCKLNGTVTFTESLSDSNKLESDCEAYADKANTPGSTVVTICTVQ